MDDTLVTGADSPVRTSVKLAPAHQTQQSRAPIRKRGRRVVLSLVVTAASLGAAQSARAQTKPTPVKAAATSDTAPTATRVAAGVDLSASAPADSGGTKAKVTAKSKAKTAKVQLAAASFPTAADVLANGRITLSDRARSDLKAGVVDPRVLGALMAMAKQNIIEVQVLKTGHSRYVAGTTRESNHYYGRAADISKVDGVAVSRANKAALSLANFVLTLPGEFRPDELGSPWSGDGLDVEVQVFTDEGHDNHLHLGFDE